MGSSFACRSGLPGIICRVPPSHLPASGGASAISDARGASVKLAFTGTGVALRTQRGPGMGKAEVWLDGVLRKVVDLYAPARSFGTVPLASDLADRSHSVRIVVLGSHRAASAGSAIVIDRWLVH